MAKSLLGSILEGAMIGLDVVSLYAEVAYDAFTNDKSLSEAFEDKTDKMVEQMDENFDEKDITDPTARKMRMAGKIGDKIADAFS